MSKFHSTVSRRDFMKGLGLAGAGLGAAAATAPVFHDLDELATSPKATFRRSWWVKERDFKNPTVEVDWTIFEALKRGTDPGGYSNQYGYKWRPEDEVYRKNMQARQLATMQERLERGDPGYAQRDWALRYGGHFNTFGPYLPGNIPFYGETVSGSGWSPEPPVSKWTGTAEEATKMVRAAAHFFGAYNIGVMELDSDTVKLCKPETIRFEAVDEPYKDGGMKVIPNRAKYVLAWVLAQSTEMTKSASISYYRGGSAMGYAMGRMLVQQLSRFLKYLGYLACDLGSSDLFNVPLGILSGVGELSRNALQLTPEHGPMIRYSPGIATDLPLVPTKPIDAGMFRFCYTCKICAQACDDANGQTPLSLADEPTYEVDGPYNRVGIKAFHAARGRCNYCPYCYSTCPFTSHNISALHNIVKGTVATTSVFNTFFRNMEGVFSYGQHDEPQYYEDWWNRDLNNWKYDSNLCGSG